ncbi:MAG: hypothetical protein ABFD20_04495 [Anaerolineales bacterium]
MKAQVVLTVAESKRLIAKGVMAIPYVQERLEKGIIVVNTGSTNGAIYEEITGTKIDRRAYLTGRTMPATRSDFQVTPLPDLVLVNGEPDPTLDRFSALDKMQPGDVYIKGANALNYAARIAGILIGHPRGGTIGGAIGTIYGSKLRLLIPVGLEKEIPGDIVEASEALAAQDEALTSIPSLWPVYGDIFTEIEAFQALCGVTAIPVASGGIAGAEGALRFLLTGEPKDVREALDLVKRIQGEPPLA